MTAESTVRRRWTNLLSDDPGIAGRMHGIFDVAPARASLPYILIGGSQSEDWGTKDRDGCEVRMNSVMVCRGDEGVLLSLVAARIEAAVDRLRGIEGEWEIVSTRATRTRLVRESSELIRWGIELRARCLRVAAVAPD